MLMPISFSGGLFTEPLINTIDLSVADASELLQRWRSTFLSECADGKSAIRAAGREANANC
jgi:hypothetical protein